MHQPEPLGRGIAEIRRQLIVQRPQGLVRDTAVLLEPRQPGIPRGRHQRPACTPEGNGQGRREKGEQDEMQHRRQDQPQAEQ